MFCPKPRKATADTLVKRRLGQNTHVVNEPAVSIHTKKYKKTSITKDYILQNQNVAWQYSDKTKITCESTVVSATNGL